MCDCYTAECESCECSIELHIEDYCTEQENVHPYCNRCSRKLKNPTAAKIFEDKITSLDQVEGTKGKHIGEKVIILCDDEYAYGIYLN